MNHQFEGAFVRVSMPVRATLAFALVVMMSLPALSEVFDIPAQSLFKAIDAFCAATGAEVYYDGAITDGLQSSAVSGNHARDGALELLLAGTDLVPLRIRDKAYLLINPGDEATRALAAAKSAQDARYRQYFAVVQQGVLQGLCRLPNTAVPPGRTVIRLWINSAGAIERLETDDDGYRDVRRADFHALLRSLHLPEAPPRDMPQPVTVVLLPAKAVAANYCPPTADMAAGR